MRVCKLTKAMTTMSLSGTDTVFNVCDFGAKGDGVTDDILAFERALNAMGPAEQVVGAVLYVPPGYYLSRTLNLTRHVRLEGASGRGWQSASNLIFATGVTGIVVHRLDTSADGGRDDWSAIRHLGIKVTAPGTREDCHGIYLRATASIDHCDISGFSGNGIQIGGDLNDFPDNWMVCRTRVEGCHHGIRTMGGDANNGTRIVYWRHFQSNRGRGVREESLVRQEKRDCRGGDALHSRPPRRGR